MTPQVARCNKRSPGQGCDATGGFNRNHAILGASESCVAVNPSDMCVALAVLDAKVHVVGPNGERQIPLTAFHRLPEDRPDQDTELFAGELIVEIELPPLAFASRLNLSKGSRPGELRLCARVGRCGARLGR